MNEVPFQKRSEPELLLDAKTLIAAAAGGGIGQEGMMNDVRELLYELHAVGSVPCLEVARIVSRRFAVVIGGKR